MIPTRPTCIEVVRKHYPELTKEGYTFYTNCVRPLSEERIAELEAKALGEKRFWDGNFYELTGELFVGTIYDGRYADGRKCDRLVPVFAKYKKLKVTKATGK